MTFWRVTPEYVMRKWTEEQLALLFRVRGERLLRESGDEVAKPTKQEYDAASLDVFSSLPFRRTVVN